jgi:hypothetical protein
MKIRKAWLVFLLCVLAAIAATSGAQQSWRRLYLYAGDVVKVGNGDGTVCDFASNPKVCIEGGQISGGQGIDWDPSTILSAQRGRGFMFFGPATFANNGGGGTGPIT